MSPSGSEFLLFRKGLDYGRLLEHNGNVYCFGTVKLALPRYVINSNLRHLEPYSTIKIERTKKKELCTKIKIKTVMKRDNNILHRHIYGPVDLLEHENI